MNLTEHQLSDFQSLELKAMAYIDTIKNSPEERLTSRKEYYLKYGFADGNQYGFGNSEIDFLEWEVERGVLAAEYHARWWYNVNLKFIYYSVLGSYVFEQKLENVELPQPVQRWVDYLKNPCSSNWYKAHNTSIIHGYIEYKDMAEKESWIEQYFINEVLDRLLYAEVMVEGETEIFGSIGKILANPRLPAVDILVKIKDLYPENYPLKFKDMLNVLDIGFDIGTLMSYVLDKLIIKRNLKKIYSYISELLDIPELEKFIVDNKVTYPQI
ncbi:hypothetical protein [Flammeovirga sp. SJP92]|uniref:hypothetical protein n=1 Tax=Flammeovirga sp. SJP92 TaxID=1775430 RepID=UPI0007870A1A|nr:hypothetical protein [Flammeovirga sp. SJP92]KXX67716.1 hypothetical protein AVL50_24925 [Flammeovirga sp. SJP92]